MKAASADRVAPSRFHAAFSSDSPIQVPRSTPGADPGSSIHDPAARSWTTASGFMGMCLDAASRVPVQVLGERNSLYPGIACQPSVERAEEWADERPENARPDSGLAGGPGEVETAEEVTTIQFPVQHRTETPHSNTAPIGLAATSRGSDSEAPTRT